MGRDYGIGSNFWKFYLIRTDFTLSELVSLVKVFRCVLAFSLTEAANHNTISCKQCIKSVICYDDAMEWRNRLLDWNEFF